MARPKLRKGDISINEVLELSKFVYTKEIDNKARRAKADVKSAKIQQRRNLVYDRSTKQWVQKGREVKFGFRIKTVPISYNDRSGVSPHEYPVVFLIKDFDQGMDSAFRWRTGSLKKPKFPKRKISEGKDKKEKDKIREENKKIQQDNIKNGIQMQFFFDSSYVLYKYGLLWGVNYANRPPKVRNPELIPFFDKHAYWIVTQVLSKLLTVKKGIIKEKLFKAEEVEDVETPPTGSDITTPDTVDVTPDDDFGLF